MSTASGSARVDSQIAQPKQNINHNKTSAEILVQMQKLHEDYERQQKRERQQQTHTNVNVDTLTLSKPQTQADFSLK